MKIINDKGMLFGKINIIDFSVIIFLVFLIPVFYLGYRILLKKPAEVITEKTFTDIELNCELIKVRPEVVKLIGVGDKELDIDGNVIGEILWLGPIESYQYNFDVGGSARILKDDPLLKKIPAKLKLKAEVKDSTLYYHRLPIRINSPLEFTTSKYNVVIVPIAEKEAVRHQDVGQIDLNVLLKNLDDATVKLIFPGDKYIDEKGNLAAEILSIDKIEKNTIDIKLGDGSFVQAENENRKQVYAKMKLMNAQLKNSEILIINGQEITQNSLLDFRTDKYALNYKIIKAYELPAYEVSVPLIEKWVNIQVKFLGVIPEITKAINEGDIEKDPSAKTVGKLKKILKNIPSAVLTLKENSFITISHPYNADILVSLDLLCVEKGGIMYFKNYPIKMGNVVTFTTDLYSIQGVIVGMYIN